MKIILPVTVAAVVIVCGYIVYRRRHRKFLISDDFNMFEVQRLNLLQIAKILNWVDTCLSDAKFDNHKFLLHVLPNKATKEAFYGKMSLSESDWNIAYLIYIEDAETKEMQFRKLVLAPNIEEGLSCLKQDKIFVIPID